MKRGGGLWVKTTTNMWSSYHNLFMVLHTCMHFCCMWLFSETHATCLHMKVTSFIIIGLYFTQNIKYTLQ